MKPSVYGQLIDRYLFNFRVNADYLESKIPVSWLKPRRYHDYGVVSFCLLRLQGVTLWPLPTLMGIDSISCAYRCAVLDTSQKIAQPSVYILGRSTNVPIVSRLGTILFSGSMPLVDAAIKERDSSFDVNVKGSGEEELFAARTNITTELNSKLFESVDEFVKFIKGGLSSYARSTRKDRLSRIDLVEDSNTYVPINAQLDYNRLNEDWRDSDLEFDSAFHASGGYYRLSYLGTVETKLRNEKVGRSANVWPVGQAM